MFGAEDTFGDLIEEVTSNLLGHTAATPRYLTLRDDITSSATSFVASGTNDDYRIGGQGLTRGIYEIDFELLYVDSSTGATASVPAWGRGFRDSQAANHLAGARISAHPAFPAGTIAREINRTITGLYPRVYAVATTSFTSMPWPGLQDLPAGCLRVLQVESRISEAEQWVVEGAWEQIGSSQIQFGNAGNVGTYRVTYASLPTSFTTTSASFSTTGLRATMRDAIVVGTTARLLRWIDASRVPVESAQADAIEQGNPIGTAYNVASKLMQQYETQVESERKALDAMYPHRVHRIRS